MKSYRLTDVELQALKKASAPLLPRDEEGKPRQHSDAWSRLDDEWLKIASVHGFECESVQSAGTGDDHDIIANPCRAVC
jgi:hypothetical protein